MNIKDLGFTPEVVERIKKDIAEDVRAFRKQQASQKKAKSTAAPQAQNQPDRAAPERKRVGDARK